MGTFTVKLGVGHPYGGDFQWVEAMVDTGASHSMVPASLLEQVLHLSPAKYLEFVLGDGSIHRLGYGEARFHLQEEEMTCPVVFGPEDEYLLGATSLEAFNLIADTSYQQLIPAPRVRI